MAYRRPDTFVLLPFFEQFGGFPSALQAHICSVPLPKKSHQGEEGRRVFSESGEENPGEEDPLPGRQFCIHSVSTMTHARQLLDFYHGGEHLWSLGRACWREEGAAKAWVEPRLHQLRHGQEEAALKEIAGLKAPRGEAGEVVRKEKNYFAGQKNRMNYKEIADRGWPIGSGAVESACRQSQCRFKRPGQFWTQPGFRNLNALDEARRNGHWDGLWITN